MRIMQNSPLWQLWRPLTPKLSYRNIQKPFWRSQKVLDPLHIGPRKGSGGFWALKFFFLVSCDIYCIFSHKEKYVVSIINWKAEICTIICTLTRSILYHHLSIYKQKSSCENWQEEICCLNYIIICTMTSRNLHHHLYIDKHKSVISIWYIDKQKSVSSFVHWQAGNLYHHLNIDK